MLVHQRVLLEIWLEIQQRLNGSQWGLLLKTPVFPMVFQHFPMVSPWFPRPGHLHHVLPGGHRRCGAALG